MLNCIQNPDHPAKTGIGNTSNGHMWIQIYPSRYGETNLSTFNRKTEDQTGSAFPVYARTAFKSFRSLLKINATCNKRGMNLFKPWCLILNMFCTACISIYSSQAQTGFKIYLIGDAGDHVESGGTLTSLQKELVNNPNSAVIFLGDNSYKDILWGLIPFGFKGFDSTRNTIEKIKSQLSILDNYHGSVFFIPGNHDWWNRTTYKSGKQKLAMEESFITQNLKQNIHIANPDKTFLPENGDYGPEYVELNNRSIRIIFIDTYRIVQTGIKKSKIPDQEKSFYERLEAVIHEGYLLKEKIMVVAHHPVYAAGPFNRPLHHPYLFGRIKASNSSFPSYRVMAARINAILSHYPGIYYASGHVHALQYFHLKDSVHYIISGAGSKEKILAVKDINKYNAALSPEDYLEWNSGGFFELEFNADTTHTTLYYNNGSQKCLLN
jgi:hypothetical protein